MAIALRPRRARGVRSARRGRGLRAGDPGRSSRASTRLDEPRFAGSRSSPALIGVAARGVARVRARERHLPARLDAEHHAPALDRHKLGHVLAAIARRGRDDGARDVVADADRPPARPHGEHVFDFEGTVGVGYVLFALGLALAVGVVWRRTVPALIAGLHRLRRRPGLRRTGCASATRRRSRRHLAGQRSGFETPALAKAWILELARATALGHAVEPALDPLAACQRAGEGGGGVKAVDPSCLPENLYNHAVYHPASRFWVFQGIETALFAGVAGALIVVRGVVGARADGVRRGRRRADLNRCTRLCRPFSI